MDSGGEPHLRGARADEVEASEDAALLGSDARSDGVDHEARKRKWAGKDISKGFMPFLIAGLIFTRSVDYVLYVRLAHHMSEYTWFLATFCIPIVFLIVLWPVVWYKMKFTNDITPGMRKIGWQYYAIIGALDQTNNILGIIPAPYVSGPVQVIFSQLVIPANMIVSYLLLNMRFSFTHYLGTLLVFTGVIIATASELLHTVTPWYWIVIMAVKVIPNAISNVYKEQGLKDKDLDEWYFNALVASYQFVFGVCTAPLVFLPILNGRNQGPVPLDAFPTYMSQATQCFEGHNPQVADPKPGDGLCGPTPYVFLAFMAFNICFNVIMFMTFKHSTSTIAMVASAVRVALSSFGFAIHAIAGPAQKKITSYDIVALVVLVLGLVAYKWRPETQLAHSDLFVDQWIEQDDDVVVKKTTVADVDSNGNPKSPPLGKSPLQRASLES